MADIIIAIAICILTLATAYMGVHVTLHPPEETSKSGWKAGFWVAAILICVLIGWQTERNGKSQEILQERIRKMPTAEENAAAVVKLEKEHPQTNVAIDAPIKAPIKHEESPKKPATTVPSKPKSENPPQVATFAVSQTSDVSDRPETPYKTHVVVQSNTEFPSLRMAIQCDGPIADGTGGPTGMIFMDTYGVVNGHPDIFVFTYQSANPPVGPSNPMNFYLWSKAPIKCSKAYTF